MRLTGRRRARRARHSTRSHDHGVLTALLTATIRGAVRLETAGEHGTARSHEETGSTVSGIRVAVHQPPLAALNGENSRAKIQNVRGDSAAVSDDQLNYG